MNCVCWPHDTGIMTVTLTWLRWPEAVRRLPEEPEERSPEGVPVFRAQFPVASHRTPKSRYFIGHFFSFIVPLFVFVLLLLLLLSLLLLLINGWIGVNWVLIGWCRNAGAGYQNCHGACPRHRRLLNAKASPSTRSVISSPLNDYETRYANEM